MSNLLTKMNCIAGSHEPVSSRTRVSGVDWLSACRHCDRQLKHLPGVGWLVDHKPKKKNRREITLPIAVLCSTVGFVQTTAASPNAIRQDQPNLSAPLLNEGKASDQLETVVQVSARGRSGCRSALDGSIESAVAAVERTISDPQNFSHIETSLGPDHGGEQELLMVYIHRDDAGQSIVSRAHGWVDGETCQTRLNR
jgi:hypothetical protein